MNSIQRLRPALGLLVVIALCLVTSADAAAMPGLSCPAENPLKNEKEVDEGVDPTLARVGKIPDAFSVASTGEALYSLTLNVPPGRQGMEPHLALAYDSSAGEGPFGMGFALSGLSSITRCASTIAQDHRIRGVRYDQEDNFCLDGLRLVPVAPTVEHSVYGVALHEYRTFPDTFRRVRAFGAEPALGPQWFIVETKTGRTLQYGERGGTPNGRVMGKNGVVRAWAVTRELDRHANTIDYVYRNDREMPGDGHTLTHVPRRIDYTGNEAGAWIAPTHAVVFDTQDWPSHVTAYTGGMETRLAPRVFRIRMLGPNEAPVRSYELTWSAGENGRTRIEKVTECAGADVAACRPPTRFDWMDQPGMGFKEVDTGIAYPREQADPSYKWLLADVTGDGLSDLVVSQVRITQDAVPISTWNVAKNLGGKLGTLDLWGQMDVPYHFGDPRLATFRFQAFTIVPMDIDHDGRTDIVYNDPAPATGGANILALTTFQQKLASTFNAPWSTALSVATPLPGHGSLYGGVLYADMNGDGVLDVITCEDQAPLALGEHPTGSWRLQLWNPAQNGFAGLGESIPIDDQRGCYLKNYIQIVDVDHDGKADLLIPPFGYPREETTTGDPACAGACTYRAIQRDQEPGGKVVSWRAYDPDLIAPTWHREKSARMLFLDVNGDGLPDAVTVNPALPGRLWTYTNTGDGFNSVGMVSLALGSPPDQDKYLSYAATLDYDGDGQTDLLLPMMSGTKAAWVVLKADASGSGQFAVEPTNVPFSDEIDKLEALGRHYQVFRSTLIPRVADLDGDGRQDVVVPIDGTFKLFLNEGPVNLLHAVTDGMNPLDHGNAQTPADPGFLPNLTIEYGSLVDAATTRGLAQDSLAAENDTYLPRSDGKPAEVACDTYPTTCVVGSRRVVKAYTINNGQNQARSFSVHYREGRSDRLGRGFLGFGAVITLDDDTHAGHTEVYDNVTREETTYPFAHQVAHAWSWVPDLPGNPFLVTRMHFVDRERTLVPTNDKATYFTLAQTTHTRDLDQPYADPAGPPSLLAFVKSAALDALKPGNVNDTTAKIADGDFDLFGNVLHETSATLGIDDTRTVARTVANDTTAWRLGEVTSETVCSTVSALQSSSRCRATDRVYDDLGEVKSETTRGGDPAVSMPLQATTTYTRDVFGNLTNVTAYDHIDGHQRAACVGYDSDGTFPFVFGNGAEHFTYVAYDPLLSVPIVVQDPNGLQTRWTHDVFGRTTQETRPDATTTVFALQRLKDGGPGGNWWALHTVAAAWKQGRSGADLDSLGRPVRSWTNAPNGPGVTTCGDSGGCAANAVIEQSTTYDFLGRVERRSKPHMQGDSSGAKLFAAYTHDNFGRLLSIETPWKTTTRYSYAGNMVTTTAPGTSSVTTNDPWGRATEVEDGLGQKTSYSYAYFGGLRTVAPPGNTPTTTERDAFGRVVSETDPDRGTTAITYDGFGERIGLIDAEHTESYDYDVLGRLVVKNDEAGQTTWHYDDPQKGLGRLAAVINPAGITKSYTYDSFGQVHTVQLLAGADSLTTTLNYDPYGRLATITPPAAAFAQPFRVRREYDDYGHLLRVKDDINPASPPYWELKQVNGAGQTTQEQMNGGTLVTTRSYSPEQSTLEHILTTARSPTLGTTTVQDLGYTYDDRLNLKSRVDGLQLILGAPLGEHFVHDALDRLTCSGLGDLCNQAVTYKANGNIDTKWDVGTYTYDPEHPHAVQSAGAGTYGYDKVGNQIERPDLTIAYTPFDLPQKYTRKADGAETLLEYDGDQARVRKTTAVDETLYFGDYERVTHLAAPSSIEHRYAVWSDERIVAIVTQKNVQPAGVPGSRAYLHVDHLGSTEKVTDAAGVILERRSYDAFGARRNPDWTQKTLSSASRGTTLGYTGHEDEDDLGLVNMKGRILDPRLARFLTTDPLVARPGFSQSWNPYSYVMNSPLKFVDPTGFEPDPELVKMYGPGVEDTILVIGARIPDRDPSVDGRPPRDTDEVNRAGNKDSGAPQAYDYANPGQSGPNAGYMGFDPDEDVREQQNDEIQRNLTVGARGLGEIVLGGATENPALVRKGAMRYAEATWIVDPRTVQVILGVYQWLSSGAETESANAVPRSGGLRPEGKYLRGGKHGIDWKEGIALAKTDGPQGQWGSKTDLAYAGDKAATLNPGEGHSFPLPDGHTSVVHRPDGTTVRANNFWVRNNGTGTFHGFPTE
jgi:RHS repeat-associated protein